MTETKSETKPTKDFWGASEIPIEIEFDWLNPGSPMIFFLGILLDGAAKEAQQEFAGLKASEKKQKLDAYYIELIATLSTRAPENVPGFPEKTDDLPETIREFFSGDNRLKKLVYTEVIDGYFAKTKRRDFFRGN